MRCESGDSHTLEALPHIVASSKLHINSGESKLTQRRNECRVIQQNLKQTTWLGQPQGQGKIWYDSYLC